MTVWSRSGVTDFSPAVISQAAARWQLVDSRLCFQRRFKLRDVLMQSRLAQTSTRRQIFSFFLILLLSVLVSVLSFLLQFLSYCLSFLLMSYIFCPISLSSHLFSSRGLFVHFCSFFLFLLLIQSASQAFRHTGTDLGTVLTSQPKDILTNEQINKSELTVISDVGQKPPPPPPAAGAC